MYEKKGVTSPPLDPTSLFTTSSNRLVKKEGEDCLLACLLTDPSASGFSLRMHNGSSVPPGMNYTVDPKRGILIQNLHPSYNADYVCVAKVQGVEKASKTFSINVIQSEFTANLSANEHDRKQPNFLPA